MKVYTKIVIDMETLEIISREEYDYYGPWEYALGTVKQMFTGSSPADQQAETEDQQFQQTMQNEQNTAFAGQQAAINTINAANAPLVNGGPYQYGFSTAEDQALQAQIENTGATATANTVAAQQMREQQESGGASVLPTGAQAALETQARETGAQQTATNLSQEKLAGYEQGNKNFEQAVGAEEQVANLENPTGFAGAATDAGGLALKAIQNVDTNNANSLTAKLLGGAIGAGLSMIPGGFGTAFANYTKASTPPAPQANPYLT